MDDPRGSDVAEGFKVGDWVVANHHRKYERGRITAVVSLTEETGQRVPLYRIEFGRFVLHLTVDEISPDPRR